MTYPAPHGTESFLLRDGDVVGFGRGVECPIRFGYAPIQDDVVPRLAGQLVVANQRVFVEGVDAPGRPAIEIAVADGPSGAGRSRRGALTPGVALLRPRPGHRPGVEAHGHGPGRGAAIAPGVRRSSNEDL